MRKWMRIDVERKPSGKPHSFTPRRMRHSWRAASLAAWHRALVAPNLRIEVATLTSAPSLWNCCETKRSSLSCIYGSFQNRVRAELLFLPFSFLWQKIIVLNAHIENQERNVISKTFHNILLRFPRMCQQTTSLLTYISSFNKFEKDKDVVFWLLTGKPQSKVKI